MTSMFRPDWAACSCGTQTRRPRSHSRVLVGTRDEILSLSSTQRLDMQRSQFSLFVAVAHEPFFRGRLRPCLEGTSERSVRGASASGGRHVDRGRSCAMNIGCSRRDWSISCSCRRSGCSNRGSRSSTNRCSRRRRCHANRSSRRGSGGFRSLLKSTGQSTRSGLLLSSLDSIHRPLTSVRWHLDGYGFGGSSLSSSGGCDSFRAVGRGGSSN